MTAYIARRILLMIPTLLGILFVSFVVVQFAPGGPVERVIAQLSGDKQTGLAIQRDTLLLQQLLLQQQCLSLPGSGDIPTTLAFRPG